MNTYQLPIGDWSDDGHGKCEWYDVTTEKSIRDVFKAYYAAKEKYPNIDPANIFSEYEEDTIAPSVVKEILALGFVPNYDLGDEDDDENDWDDDDRSESELILEDFMDSNIFAQLVVWFINLGDSELNLVLHVGNSKNQLISWNDEKNSFPMLGYGLFR